MNLVLIGYRCSGKSTISRSLADVLGWPVIHIDEEIAATARRPILEIVKTRGWEGFREIEREVVEAAAKHDESVIDTGGSVVLDPRNVSALRARGRLMWLKTSVSEIIARMRKADMQRIPLTGAANAVDEVEEMVRRLDILYAAAADHRVDTDGKSIQQVAKEVLALVSSIK